MYIILKTINNKPTIGFLTLMWHHSSMYAQNGPNFRANCHNRTWYTHLFDLPLPRMTFNLEEMKRMWHQTTERNYLDCIHSYFSASQFIGAGESRFSGVWRRRRFKPKCQFNGLLAKNPISQYLRHLRRNFVSQNY